MQEHGIETVYLDKKPGLDFSFFRSVKKAVKDFKPDVIHTHLLSMLYLFTSYKRKHIKLHTMHTIANKENFGYFKIVNFLAFKIFGVIPVGISDTVGDVDAMQKYITELLCTNTRESMSKNSIEKVKENYLTNVIVTKFKELYIH